MIIHGNKQISGIIYAREALDGGGAVALTNIIRGPQVVFGGLEPSWLWLSKAARQAILVAFGQTDGMAVIKATNRYLNQLAASDRDKATALAALLNEDPMMVCSLGLEVEGVTMPIRWIHRTGLAYIDTGIAVNAAYPFELDCDWIQFSGDRGAILSNFDAANVGIGYELRPGGAVRHYFNGDKGEYNNFPLNTLHTIRSTYNAQTGVIVSVIDGTTYNPSSAVQSGTATKNLLWMTDHRISTLSAQVQQASQRILANGIEHKYLPMLRSNNEIGVMDMASDGTFTFRKNAYTSGSFNLEYTRNGQPWTPSTP